ncbi:uncharacterized protein AB675_6857 [Cyphellophora attinorum]|uniref:MARVEL domain-containing protein n=1 Tax=Cyphellophora attinorum TaxID=1664694 RepID=A0A0N1HEF1_9EURO|nr:uncharacterized protein AB675_6857 [Phialophora attinorum]KPI43175.1 hypothetical protein AB675_6857 [Phialophora attinorum]
MPFPDLALIPLYGLALLFSIIELGISAYAVSLWDDNRFTRNHTPSEYSFLLFASIWTILALVVVGLLDFLRHGRYSWLGWAVLGLNFVTWIFWLSGFAALAAFFGGTATGTAGALLAFAVMLWYVIIWRSAHRARPGPVTYVEDSNLTLTHLTPNRLIFTAILILNALTAFSVLRSERHSHRPLFSREGRKVNSGPSMSTA